MWSESLTIYDPAQEIANRLEAESEGDMGKCKTCVNGYPSVSCVSCGTGFRNYVSNKEENMKVRPLGKDQYRTLWIDLIEKCNAQQQEIERLNKVLDDWKYNAKCDADHIAGLLADKDEQAGNPMRLEEGLKKQRNFLQLLNELGGLGYQKHGWIKSHIAEIDALLGGGEDGSSKDTKIQMERMGF